MVLCNMAVEMGAKTAYMEPNQAVLDYVAGRTSRPFTVEQTDSDFEYQETYVFDISGLKPQVSMPPAWIMWVRWPGRAGSALTRHLWEHVPVDVWRI